MFPKWFRWTVWACQLESDSIFDYSREVLTNQELDNISYQLFSQLFSHVSFDDPLHSRHDFYYFQIFLHKISLNIVTACDRSYIQMIFKAIKRKMIRSLEFFLRSHDIFEKWSFDNDVMTYSSCWYDAKKWRMKEKHWITWCFFCSNQDFMILFFHYKEEVRLRYIFLIVDCSIFEW